MNVLRNSEIMTTLDMLFFPYLFPLLGILGKLGKSVITINDFVALQELYGGGSVIYVISKPPQQGFFLSYNFSLHFLLF